jgi:hypothetical protein
MHKRQSVCIVGKGYSLLSKRLGSLIDSHDIIIRVNHIPDESNFTVLGLKTHIFSSRSEEKLFFFIRNIKNEKVWICSDNIQKFKYERFIQKPKYQANPNIEIYKNKSNTFQYMTKNEMSYIEKFYKNKLNLKLYKEDLRVGFCIPDTGMTTISLALLRFPSHDISICGFDLYKEGNHNIYQSNYNSSIFITPVLQEILLYKNLIRSGKIKEL